MTLDEQIAVLQAAKEGKTIQVRPTPPCLNPEWCDIDPHYSKQCNFNGKYQYRVKPRDRKINYYLMVEGAVHLGSCLGDMRITANVEATFNPQGELIRVELI